MVSEVKYISFRTLATESVGNPAKEPLVFTCDEMLVAMLASAGITLSFISRVRTKSDKT